MKVIGLDKNTSDHLRRSPQITYSSSLSSFAPSTPPLYWPQHQPHHPPNRHAQEKRK